MTQFYQTCLAAHLLAHINYKLYCGSILQSSILTQSAWAVLSAIKLAEVAIKLDEGVKNNDYCISSVADTDRKSHACT